MIFPQSLTAKNFAQNLRLKILWCANRPVPEWAFVTKLLPSNPPCSEFLSICPKLMVFTPACLVQAWFCGIWLEATPPPPPRKNYLCHPCQNLLKLDFIKIALDVKLPETKMWNYLQVMSNTAIFRVCYNIS